MKKITKALSFALSLLMIFSVCTAGLPAVAASMLLYTAPEYSEADLRTISDNYGYELTDDEIAAIVSGETTLSDVAESREEDVTLIVQLSADGVLNSVENAVSDGELSFSAEWTQYRMEKNQESVQNRIEKNVFDGEDVEILYSYTLITNAFAITAKKSQLDEIAAVKGVESVYTAPEYYAVPTDAESEIDYADNYFTGSDNTTSFDGSGTAIAVIDTGLDLTHEAFANDVSNAKFDEETVASALANTTAYKRTNGTVTVEDVYHSSKVPFIFNYSDNNNYFDVSHNNDDQTDHGTHVAGIAAGYAVNAEGKVVFSGVAPEAQIVVMKVFGYDRAGNAADIMAAVEDAVILGVDVINLSLGSWGGFSYAGDYPKVEVVYQAAAQAGIVVACAAGNDYSAAYGTLYGNDLALASNPDNGMINSPASYDDNFAVASVSGNQYMGRFLSVSDRKITYTNNATDASRNIEKFLGQNVQYAVLKNADGTMLTGKSTDFEEFGKDCGIAGKIAVVRRGAVFTETISHAQAVGAIGLIVCDHSEGALISMAENDSATIPALFISKADGDYLLANESTDNTIVIENDATLVENISKGTMSAFSSWGVTADLKLKPEITAYGGVVYSTRNNGTYGLLSGTSMASPYIAGVAALVAQKYAVENAEDAQAMLQARKDYATSVMMSTATPVIEPDSGVAYSPRKQGAGLVNIDAALSTLAHITVDGSVTPKIDMGDDKEKNGVYDLTFNVVNDSAKELTFTVDATVQTEKVEIQDVSYLTQRVDPEKADAFMQTGITYSDSYADRVYYTDELTDVKFMSGLPYDLTAMSIIKTDAQDNRIVVPANETVSVTVTVTLGDEAKAYMDENFENGIYVEGFITLTSETEGQPDLNVPYMGFYGDWTMAPALDEGTWEDIYMGNTVYPQMDVSTGAAVYDGSQALVSVHANYPLGISKYYDNPYELYANGIEYIPDVRNTFGGEPGLHLDSIGAELALLRNAKSIRFTVTDVETDEVYAVETRDYVRKSYFYSESVGMINGGYFVQNQFLFDGINQNTGKEIADGTTVRYEVEVFLDYGEEEDQNNKRNTFSFVATYDTTPPEVKDMDVYIDQETGDLMLDVITKDAGCLSVMWVILIGYTANGSYTHYEFRNVMPGGGVAGECVTSLNLSEYSKQANIANLRSVFFWDISDLNDIKAINPDPSVVGSGSENYYYISFYDNVKLTFPAGVMSVGDTKNIDFNKTYGLGYRDEEYTNASADNNKFGIYEEYYFSSSDPEIASIDMGGKITAKEPGYTTISVTTEFGKVVSTCRIRVIENVIQKQIDATPEGGTLVVNDGDLIESVAIDKDITLDLNGSTLTSADGSPAIRVTNGQVTITNGTILTELSKDEQANHVLLDMLNDNNPAIMISGGEVTLDNVTVKGATASYGDATFTAGSAVKLINGAQLYLHNANLYGLYAVNNTDCEEENGSNITIASGHLEGLLGSIASMENVYGEDGSAFVDTTNLQAGESVSYIGTEAGVAFEQSLFTGLVITAQDIANATVTPESTLTYNAEKDCAVFTFNGVTAASRAVDTQYLTFNQSIDADKYKAMLLSYDWTTVSTGNIVPYVTVKTDLDQKNKTAQTIISGVYNQATAGRSDVMTDLSPATTEWTGKVDTFYFIPLAQKTPGYTVKKITNATEVELYQLIFFENATQAANYAIASNIASTNNLFVANAQTYNTKFSYDDSELLVNVVLDDVSDGTYTWVPTNLSLYTRVENADGSVNDTFVATNAVALDANGEINTAFNVSDPDANYVVKCDFDLALTADTTAELYAAEETEVTALASNLSAMLADIFMVEELENALIDLVDFILYDVREGFVERDALYIDSPLRPSLVPDYFPDHPDMIGINLTNDLPTWVSLWDARTLPEALEGYLMDAAAILGDATMKPLMVDLQSTLPAATWNKLDVNYRTGNYGSSGSLPALKAIMSEIDALSADVDNRAELNALLTQFAATFTAIYESLLVLATDVNNAVTDKVINYMSYNGLNSKLADNSYYGAYNEKREELRACLEAFESCYTAQEQAVAALKYAALETGVFSALANYKDADNTSALLSLYFDDNALVNNGTTGITSTFEMNANYDGYITYVLNGGKNTKENPNGYKQSAPVSFAPATKSGYTFDGWYTSADFAADSRMDATDAATEGDITLYAKWVVSEYKITYMVNDEVFAEETFAYGAQTTATAKQVNVTGFVFNYWYEDYPHNEYTFGTMPASDVVLYANLDYIDLNNINETEDNVYSWQFENNTPVRLVINRSCTIDFNGKTITNMDDMAAIVINNRANVTIKNAVIVPQAYSDISAENCSVLVTDNAKVKFENCHILGAKDARDAYYVGNAVDVNYGSIVLQNSVLSGMYAVKNDKGDGVYYDCAVEAENSILLGVAAPVSVESALTVIGEKISASDLLAVKSAYADTRFIAAFNVPSFTWDYVSGWNNANAYSLYSRAGKVDVISIEAPAVTYNMPDDSVITFTASEVTVNGESVAITDGYAHVEIPADYEKYNHSVAVDFACNVKLAQTTASGVVNMDSMVVSAMQSEIAAFDALADKYVDLFDTWDRYKRDIKDKFYQFYDSDVLRVYLTNIRKRLENIGGADYTGNYEAGEGLIPVLSKVIAAYQSLSEDGEKFEWLMLNKSEIISLTVEMDDDFNSIYTDCVLLNGLSTVYYGDDYSAKLGYVEEVCERSNAIRNMAESLPAVAEAEYMAAKDRDAFINDMLSAEPEFSENAEVDKTTENAVEVKDTFATYTVVYELYDEFLDETVAVIYVVQEGEEYPSYTPEPVEGRTFTGWTQDPVQFPITKITYKGSLLKDSYTITFKAEGSEDIIKTAKYGDAFTDIPAVPEREHYNQTPAYWEDKDLSFVDENIVINAVYTPDVYKVVFKAEGSEDIVRTVNYGESLTDIPAIPEREHYNQTAPVWDVTSFESISSDMTVNAIYTPNVYEVVFLAEGCDAIVKTVTYGEILTDIPAVPERKHYDQTPAVWDVTDFDSISSNLTVNAIYTPNVYNVVFKAEGSEDIIKSVTYGKTLADIPAVPEREHYNQIAPYWDVESFEGIGSDITVNAVYTANVYNVTWVVEGAETFESYTYNTLPEFNGELAKACDEDVYYVFDCWTPAVTAATKDVTYTAVFTAVQKDTSDVAIPSDLTAVYGSTLASINLPKGFVWKDASLSVGNVGVNSFVAVFTPEDTEHYLVEEITLQVSVTKATPNVSVPTVTVVQGHKLNEFKLPVGFEWADGNAVAKSVGETTCKAVFTPKDTLNYNTVTVDVVVSVVIPAQYCALYGHDYSISNVVAPDCTNDGYTLHKCAMCGNEYSDTVVGKLGHKYSITRVAPTCTNKGYTKHSCTVCGNSYNDSYVAATGHTYKSSVRTEPTCTQTGVKQYTCKDCSHSYTESIAAFGHKDDNGDGYCDRCNHQICDHMCHKTGFVSIFWKLTRFFNKLFKKNQYCECGYQHW